ncbi:dihydropteroate synthase [Trichloromonas sp.]|uniref:dihydropteroate synthase n=1 Tax=Trichloromonas sp. TaxID=3069249 RepID=UPI003D817A89
MPFLPRLLHVDTEAEARREILLIGADPAGAERMAAKMVRRLVKLSRVPCRAANVLKQEMLAVGGDAAVARGSVACSLPETDVILIGTLKQLRQLAGRLGDQPFGLRELADELRGLLARLDQVPDCLVGRSCRLSLDRPRIMGILNVTPDSFSDGGRYSSLQAALEKGRSLAQEGADIIDVGGESTRPGAQQVSAQEEIDRVVPVIEALSREVSCPLSVDTTKSVVAAAAVAAGADFINDISGLMFDPAMAAVAADNGSGLFLMHTRGRPETMQSVTRYQDLVAEVIDYLGKGIAMALQAGVSRDRLAIDPGIGFGKSVEGNLEILRRIGEFRSLGCPILLGTSRKSFIGKVLGEHDPARRLYGTLATVALGVAQGVMIHRVHDVAPARETAMLAWAIRAAGSE